MAGGPAPRVSVWSIQDRRDAAVPRPWVVRWKVGSRMFSRAYTHRAQADDYHARLRIASSDGLRFSEGDGLPEAWTKDNPTVAVYAARWLERQWPTWSPRSRVSAVDSVVRAVEAAVTVKAPKLSSEQAERVRHYLREHLLLPGGDDPCPEDKVAADYIARHSLHLQDLDASAVVLLHHSLGVGDDGAALSPNTANRRRTMAKAVLSAAVAEELLPSLNWPKTARRQKTKTTESYNPDLVIDPVTFQAVMDQMCPPKSWRKTARYRAYLSVIFYAGLRPSEAAALQRDDLTLPDSGWGSIKVRRTSRREDPAGYRDAQDADTGPGKTGARTVPIPPVLVGILREHTRRFLEEDGELFTPDTEELFTSVSAGSRSRLWSRAKRLALPAGSRLLDATPYDLRHSCATLMLKAGVPIPEIARRLGHSPETLMKVYAGVLEGDEERANDLLDRVWGPRAGP